MRIIYKKAGQKYCLESSEDFELKVNKEGAHTSVQLLAKSDIELIRAIDTVPASINKKDLFFLNGYQSWTDTKEFKFSNRLRDVRKCPHLITHLFSLKAYGDGHIYNYSSFKLHSYDLFYEKGESETLVYSDNFDVAYLIIELRKCDKKHLNLISDLEGLSLKKGESVQIFSYYQYPSVKEGLEAFNKQFPLLKKDKIFGYTSWYNYFQNINEEIILRDLSALDNRFNLFQIDDGYESFVGDWIEVDKNKFPNGLEPIVKKIHEKGLKAGLWLAPLVAETKSKVFQEHPEWFKKDKKGNPLKAGCNWSGMYAFDLENKEAREHIKKSLEHYANMGFDFFKLDFLYAAGYASYKGKSRCMAQKEAYQFLREVLKDKLILGCGANLVNSYPAFDYLRIGPDVSLKFDDVAYMKLLHRERPSTKITLQNTIFRSVFDQRLFANDPDVFLLRDTNISLSKEQKEALTKINALFGSVLMTSDDIAEYDDDKKRVLSEALEIFKHATDKSYVKRGKLIDIKYKLNNEEHSFTYNTKKGVLSDVR